MHHIHSLLRAGLVAVALAAGGAHAATVSYDFVATGAAGNGSGTFTFDDSAGAVNLFGETEYALTGFSFSFGSNTFGLTDLDASPRFAVFDGSQLLGLDLAKAGAFGMVPSIGGAEAFLVDGAGRSTSTLVFRLNEGQPLPEPGTGALALLAAGALWAGRRKASAHA